MSADRRTIENAVQLHKDGHQELLETYLRLFANGREIWIFDNTFWDDAVTFVEGGGKDLAWAEANWGEGLSTVGADALMVYDQHGNVIYKKTAERSSIPAVAIDAKALVGNGPVHHFFVRAADDIVEVQTATIHPTADRAHAGPPAGVLVLLTRWDADALKTLAELLKANVQILPPDAPMASASNSKVSVEVPLRDLSGKTVAELRATSPTPALSELYNQRASSTRITLLSLVAMALIIALAMHRWVSVPIARLSLALHRRDAAPLAPLRSQPDEFGALAVLTESYFAQNEQMKSEITERIAAQDEVTRSLLQKEILLREIHHRVKNNLQMISSLLTLQSEQMPSPEARALLTECVHRVRSMAMIHQQLYGVESIDRIELSIYVNTLAESLRVSLSPECRLRVNAAPVELGVDLAVPLGLILNELLTNAFKYGSAPPEGRVDKGWDVLVTITGDAARFTVTVQDCGPGLPDDFNLIDSGTLGMQLVRALTRQIKAKLSTSSADGASFVLEYTQPVS
jgi:two-component sensor histidine kinase/sensor domain CHASE-containing protein